MHSPPVEWSLHVLHFAVLDVVRDRGEPDGDTASEVIRDLFHVDTPTGRLAFALTLAAGSTVLFRHICKDTGA